VPAGTGGTIGYEKSAELTSTTEWVCVCSCLDGDAGRAACESRHNWYGDFFLGNIADTFLAMVASNNAKRLDQLAGSNQCECTHKNSGCRNV
jgi:hypothetical protein